MDSYETFFNIADIRIRILSPFPFLTFNGEEFRCSPGTADYVFRFLPCADIPAVMADSRMVGDVDWAHEYQKPDGSYLRAFLWKERFYDAVSILGTQEGVCWYASVDILRKRMADGFEMLNYLCPERLLMCFSGLVLHSSHIALHGRGLVFSAPSQTGKSTQAELWRQYTGAAVINGDRSVLRKKAGIWQVYGCPMCGTSNIHLQGGEPLDHIVMLAQSERNLCRRIRGAAAWKLLYPQITIPGFDASFTIKAMELLEQLMAEVPVWQYDCTKEPDAVTALRQAIGWPEGQGVCR